MRVVRDRVWLYALLISLAVHCVALAVVQTWSGGSASDRKVVCPQFCRPAGPLLVELERVPVPQARADKSDPSTTLRVNRSAKTEAAAPKRGRIALPPAALQRRPERAAEIMLERPALPAQAVTVADTEYPMEATPEVFERAGELVASAPSVSGLGGTGTATGAGAFGNNSTGLNGQGSGVGGQGPGAVARATTPATPAPSSPTPPAATQTPAPKGETRPPRLIHQTPPAYPPEAQRRGKEGSVLVRVTVNADGSVGEVATVTSSGEEALDDAAKREVKQWRFLPALCDGKAVAQPVQVRVKFRIAR